MNYEQQLRRELADLRTYRVDLRRQIAKGPIYQAAGDWLDNRQRFEERQRQLAATDKRYHELHHLLGIRLSSGRTISLQQAAPVQRAAPRTVPSFVTRMINGPGCR